MKKKLVVSNKLLYFIMTIVLASVTVNIMVHELTHYILLGNAKGICIGVCEGENGINAGMIYPEKPYYTNGTNETIPTIIGLLSAVIFTTGGLNLYKNFL